MLSEYFFCPCQRQFFPIKFADRNLHGWSQSSCMLLTQSADLSVNCPCTTVPYRLVTACIGKWTEHINRVPVQLFDKRILKTMKYF